MTRSWPNYNRLGSARQLITLAGRGQWELVKVKDAGLADERWKQYVDADEIGSSLLGYGLEQARWQLSEHGDPEGMWGLSRDFNEDFCAHVIRWFKSNGASEAMQRYSDGAKFRGPQ